MRATPAAKIAPVALQPMAVVLTAIGLAAFARNRVIPQKGQGRHQHHQRLTSLGIAQFRRNHFPGEIGSVDAAVVEKMDVVVCFDGNVALIPRQIDQGRLHRRKIKGFAVGGMTARKMAAVPPPASGHCLPGRCARGWFLR